MNDEQVIVQNGRLANVFVQLVDAEGRFVPSQPVIVDQKDCTYRPRLQGAIAGQPISIRNDDGTLHNVHAYEVSRTLFNVAQPPGSPAVAKTFSEPGVVKLKCDVHPWMAGYVVVTKSPYFAVTKQDGSFDLLGVPAGTYTLQPGAEAGAKTAQVTVQDHAAANVPIVYSADDRGT